MFRPLCVVSFVVSSASRGSVLNFFRSAVWKGSQLRIFFVKNLTRFSVPTHWMQSTSWNQGNMNFIFLLHRLSVFDARLMEINLQFVLLRIINLKSAL